MSRKKAAKPAVHVRQTRPEDVPAIKALSEAVYPHDVYPWDERYLESHLRVFPRGQLVAVGGDDGRVLGMAASLIVDWDDYTFETTWMEMTEGGYFTNHDPKGRTLYGAEVMVHPEAQGMGVGKAIYAARRTVCRDLGLRRIRAGARLRGYAEHADRLTPEQYVVEVVNRRIGDPTLSFQLKQGFRVIAVVRHYLAYDPASHGHAAVIEWVNHQVVSRREIRNRDPRYARKRRLSHFRRGTRRR